MLRIGPVTLSRYRVFLGLDFLRVSMNIKKIFVSFGQAEAQLLVCTSSLHYCLCTTRMGELIRLFPPLTMKRHAV